MLCKLWGDRAAGARRIQEPIFPRAALERQALAKVYDAAHPRARKK